MSTHRRLLQAFSVIVILSMMFSGFSLPVASAQEGDGIERQVNAQTGKVSFIGPESGRVLSATKALGISPSARPADPGMALAKRFGPEFGLKDPARDLTRLKTNLSANGRRMFRYQQNYEGIPVMGGELIVNTNGNGDLYSMNGEVSPDLSLSTQPTVDPGQAQQAALKGAARWYQKAPADFVASTPELWIFDESLLRPSTRPAELVWRMEVTPKEISLPVRELVLVNAQRGGISLHFNQIDTAWGEMRVNDRDTASSALSAGSRAPKASASLQAGSVVIETYTGNNSRAIALPGILVCDQSSPLCTEGDDLDADYAHAYAIGTYNFYYDEHGRLGIDDNNMDIISTVDYCDPDTKEACPYDNAYWSGTQMVYGSSETYARADDIVAHELTHGVTQYASNLFYYYQSGAINESFSDLWAEYYDQTNGQGSDTGYEWLIGEDAVGVYSGPYRSMSNPPAYGDPDRMSHDFYYTDTGDNGGVHYNSGINNKAVYLMVEGDTLSGVTSIGWEKTAAIYYEANTNLLTSGADYSDLYHALQQACSNLIGNNGITGNDCVEVKDALDAVEMNLQPEDDFNTDIPECDSGNPPVATSFYDDLESGTGNWTFSNGAHERWQLDSVYGPYAHSGAHSLYADDWPVEATDATAQLTPIVIPNNAYLHFAHAYEFDTDGSTYYDGGVLEYRIAGQSNWINAGPLMDVDNGYEGTIATGYNNPLAVREAFVSASHGYISTRVNLASLAGKIVTFRWRMGLDRDRDVEDDTDGYGWGWWVDDVKVYRCQIESVGPGIYDDRDAGWTYAGSWAQQNATGPYLGTFSYTSAANGTASFPFTGNKFTLYYTQYTNRGQMEVYIDDMNTPVTTINANGSLVWQKKWTSNTLTAGGHMVMVKYKSGTMIDIDAIQVYGPLPAGMYDDRTGWIYSGTWGQVTTNGPYLKTFSHTSAAGATASFAFDGIQFTLYYTQYTNRGQMEVYIDDMNNPVTTINANGSLFWQKSWTSNTLTAGGHTVMVKYKSGTMIDIDAIRIYGAPDTIKPGSISDLSAVTGTGSGSVNLSWTAVGDDGSSGTATAYLVKYSTLAITDETAWTNATAVTSGVPTPQAAGQAESMVVSGLVPGQTYFFAVRAQDEKPNLGDLAASSPSAVAKMPTPLPVGLYDDRHAGWTYNGTWGQVTTTGPYQKTFTYAATAGNTAMFSFNGNQLTLYYTQYTNRGEMEVYIDDMLTPVTTINANGPLVWQKKWTSNVLTVQVHTVMVKYKSGGSMIDIDAIQIYGPAQPGMYDDRSGWTYTGNWAQVNTTGPYLGTYTYSKSLNDTGTFNFYGDQVTLYYSQYTNRGEMAVYIDDMLTPVATINANGSLVWQKTWTSAPLALDAHTLKVEHLSGTYTDVDAVQVHGPMLVGKYDDKHVGWTYVGTWTQQSATSAYLGAFSYASAPGATASFTFEGSRVILSYTQYTNRGEMAVYIDDMLTPVATINANGSLVWQKTWTSNALTPGEHTLMVQYLSGTMIDIDAIQIE